MPDHELHYYLVLRETLQATAQETRQIITLAQLENDRRNVNRTRCLAFTTTILSALLALGGVALGAYLTRDEAIPNSSVTSLPSTQSDTEQRQLIPLAGVPPIKALAHWARAAPEVLCRRDDGGRLDHFGSARARHRNNCAKFIGSRVMK